MQSSILLISFFPAHAEREVAHHDDALETGPFPQGVGFHVCGVLGDPRFSVKRERLAAELDQFLHQAAGDRCSR